MGNPLKVAHLVFTHQMWGVEKYILNLAKSLEKDGVETWVLCGDAKISETYRNSGIQVVPFSLSGYLDVMAVLRLKKVIEEKKISVLHTHLGLDSLLGAVVATWCKIPVVMSVHFLEPAWAGHNVIKKFLWKLVQRWKNKHIWHFLPITPQVGNALAERERVEGDRMTVIWPGVPQPSMLTHDKSDFRSKFEIHPNEIVVTSVSRLEREKNLEVLVEAAETLVREFQNMRFIVAGEGSMRASLEKRISESQLQGKFTLLGYCKDVCELLAASDIFVLPASAEPFGMAAVEAMFASLPVVGFANAGLSFIVSNGRSGMLLELDNVRGLCDAISALVRDPEMRASFGRAGFERASQNFSSDKMAKGVLKVYEDLVDSAVCKTPMHRA